MFAKPLYAFVCCVFLLLACGEQKSDKPATTAETEAEMPVMTPAPDRNIYLVQRVSEPPQVDAVWDKPLWQRVPTGILTRNMGQTPLHFPKTEFKMVYDDQALYVIFRVDDQFVRSVSTEYQGPVYKDSCVEFFFTPGTDITQGYFNLETNAGGNALFYHQEKQGVNARGIDPADFAKIEIAHSLPDVVDPEIKEPTIWTLEYRLPLDILDKYAPVKSPAKGAQWRANFYKCADATSRPHWLTWSEVQFERPNFHLPEFFGELHFQ